MSTLHIKSVLVYYDGPQVFEARDLAGGSYICIAAPHGTEFDCIAIRIEPARLHAFIAGACDLLSLITKRDSTLDWYYCNFEGEFLNAASVGEGWQVPIELLPEEGFYHEQKSGAPEVVEVAAERRVCIVAVSLWDGNSGNANSVKASTLGAVLLDFQRVFSRAFSNWQRTNRNVESTVSVPALTAFASAPGSYKIYLEADSSAGLFGSSNAVNAFIILDKILEDPMDTRRTVDALVEYKGHFAGAMHSLFKTMVQNNVSLSYTYADFSDSIARGSTISLSEAKAITKALSERETIDAEPVPVVGVLEKIDAVSGAWRLHTENKSVSGKTDADGPKLTGLTIGELYTFLCEERIEVLGDGSERSSLLLKSIS